MAVDPCGLWGAGGGSGRTGRGSWNLVYFMEVIPFRTPGVSALGSPLAGGKVKHVNGTDPLTPSWRQCPSNQHSSWSYYSPGCGDRIWGRGRVAQPYLWRGRVPIASFVWVWPVPVRDGIFPGTEQTAEQSPPEEQ